MKKNIKKLFFGAASSVLIMASLPALSQTTFPLSRSVFPTSVEANTNFSAFLKEAKSLPNISMINYMNHGLLGIMDFDATKSDIIHTRNLYNRLSSHEKNNPEIKRWEGYLKLKETAIGITFVNDSRSLPSVSRLKQMSGSQLSTQIRKMEAIRSSYNKLSNGAKGDKDVKRWEGYLSTKESAVSNTGSNFVETARKLPTISAINNMDYSTFQSTKVNIRKTRNTYDNLNPSSKKKSNVIRWEGYLSAKEKAIGLYFIQEAQSLPSVSAIRNMNDSQRTVIDTDLKKVRNNHNSLSQSAKNDNDVSRWQEYLSQKEAALVLSAPNIKERVSQINHKWAELKPINTQVEYIEYPSTQPPFSLGELTDTTLNDALNVTNFIRYVSYLPADVQLNDSFNEEAQAAAVVNAVNNTLTHYPEKPANMNDSMYQLGYDGASSSNIGMGYSSIISSITSGYMEDGDPSNIDRVGHRLWTLSPRLKEVGFGYAGRFTAMKVISNSMWEQTPEPYNYVSWPAETAMPLYSYGSDVGFWNFRYPWSVSLNANLYDNSKITDIEVELTRINDNKKWYFSSNSNDGYFNVSTESDGSLPYTIIFRPDKVDYKPGDHYRVTITGIKSKDGAQESVSFETAFFNLTN